MKFVLNRLQSNRPISSKLPFPLSRKLGEVGDTSIVKPVEPPKPDLPKNPFKPLIGFDVACVVDNAVAIEHCQNMSINGDKVANCQNINRTDGMALANYFIVWQSVFYPVANCQNTSTIKPVSLVNCAKVWQIGQQHLTACSFFPVVKTVHYGGCVAVFDSVKHHFNRCQNNTILPTIEHGNCIKSTNHSQFLTRCQSTSTSHTVPVPCRYYPIPELPPTVATARQCRIRPPSNRLPFALRRKSHQSQGFSAKALPFPLTCWHDLPPPQTPDKGTYIVHNIITATVGGLQIDLLSFSIKTDMNSFCWQGQVEITSKSYERIKTKVDVERGQEALISVVINGHYFVILCEDISKTRSFVNHSYTLSGRSVTAHLSKDYANMVKLDNDFYASQIVHEALKDLPIKADFGVDDWRTYITMTGTPIAIIDEVAKACGGFVMSDKADGKLYVKKRYKVPAWELATTTPDRIIPLDVIKSISEQKRTNPRFNAVILTSSKEGAIVCREREARDRHAPVSQNELYTDRACIIPAGIAILSDSGTHQIANLTMRWADKYNLPLAELGEIWQINDVDGSWRGIVKAVAVDVKVDNGVPSVWQVVELDRYLDK